jgi:hypothetical protein
MIPFDLALYGISQLDYYLKQGKVPLDAFSDALIDTISKFGALIAEEVIRQFFLGLKTLFKDVFSLW